MKKLIKNFLRSFRSRKLSEAIRWLRKAAYAVFDALGYVLFFPFASKDRGRIPEKQEVQKILLIRIDRIGDLVLTTPAIRAVRETYPEAVIHLLVASYTKDLVVHNTQVNQVLVYQEEKIARDYDLAIALHPGWRTNQLAFLSGAKFRLGYTGWGGGFLLTHRQKDDRAQRVRHEVESVLEVVGLAGCETQNRTCEVSVTAEGERFAEEFLGRHQTQEPLVLIHPGSRQPYIRWNAEGFAEVADRLIQETRATVLLIGTPAEEPLVREVLSHMNEKALWDVNLRLTGLVSILKRSQLFIGNSTGPMHVAAASGPAVVAIFGSRHPLDCFEAWGPWCERKIIVSKDVGCPQCHPTDCHKGFACLGAVSSAEVFQAAKDLLEKSL